MSVNYARDTNIGKYAAANHTDGLLSTLITTIKDGFSVSQDIAREIWEELQKVEEWNWELVDQIVDRLEAIRLQDVILSNSVVAELVATLTFAKTASGLRTSESTNALTELKAIVANNATAEEALEELKKIKVGTDLILGQEIEESSD